ncbi:MerC domain-containing protein [Thermomonas sp.]|uniref:MerC domain-containing protein n=1 Tax=Thermomonas sp. TaxID=1971895 RepID=UPI002634F578|nr:MerC domain-containing protein [Thermomonas sp.]
MNDRVPAAFDRIGATGSLICAIHCALLPLLIAALPSLGLAVWLGDGFEAAFVAFASLFGLAVLVWGYRRHRAVRALGLLLPGLAALWLAILYAPLHHSVLPHALVMTFGGVLVGLAHWQNLRLNHGHVHGASCASGRCGGARRDSTHETA